MTIRLACALVLPALACAVPAAASSAHCTPPVSSRAAWQSLHESGLGCDTARTLALHYYANGRLTHWRCTSTVRNRYVSFTCQNEADHGQTLAGSWNVH